MEGKRIDLKGIGSVFFGFFICYGCVSDWILMSFRIGKNKQ